MKTLTGQITKLAQDKTASVTVTRRWMHPLYKKYVKRTKKYACHVDGLKLAVGDDVLIQECRPMSKTKKFKVVKILDQGKI